ncbi:21134_t:CDS:1, partial [Gigaspora margarita]
MPQKNTKQKRLERLLRSQDSTPEQIWDAFTDHMKSTKEYHNRRSNRDEISKEEHYETIKSLDKLEFQVKGLINQEL